MPAVGQRVPHRQARNDRPVARRSPGQTRGTRSRRTSRPAPARCRGWTPRLRRASRSAPGTWCGRPGRRRRLRTRIGCGWSSSRTTARSCGRSAGAARCRSSCPASAHRPARSAGKPVLRHVGVSEQRAWVPRHDSALYPGALDRLTGWSPMASPASRFSLFWESFARGLAPSLPEAVMSPRLRRRRVQAAVQGPLQRAQRRVAGHGVGRRPASGRGRTGLAGLRIVRAATMAPATQSPAEMKHAIRNPAENSAGMQVRRAGQPGRGRQHRDRDQAGRPGDVVVDRRGRTRVLGVDRRRARSRSAAPR